MSAIADLRGLLFLVERSDWREFSLRTGDWSVFMARPGGGPDPMLSGGETVAEAAPIAQAPFAPPAPATTISAPHIATFVSALPVGSEVALGAALARIELLGETIDVTTENAGFVTAILVEPGALVEYGQPMVEIVAS
jgi:biotin carboxyl carrier protein